MDRTAEYFRERNFRQFEEKVVKHLLQEYGLTKKWKTYLLERYRRRERTTGLTLADFQQLFTEFPIQLCASELDRIEANNRLTQMLTNFDKLPITREFLWKRAWAGDETKSFGLVIKWPFLKSGAGAAVLHDSQIDFAAPGQRLCFVAENGAEPLVLETLDSLLNSIDSFSANKGEQPWYEITEVQPKRAN